MAVVSPSFGAAGAWPHRTERGTAYLGSLGLKVRLMPNAALNEGWASASPEARTADLHAAFADDEVAVVLASIGGNHSNQLLPLLDFELIREHPKVFQGYSDMTVLHWAIAKHAGLVTFYGPALVSGSASSRRFSQRPAAPYAPRGSAASRSPTSRPPAGPTSSSTGKRAPTSPARASSARARAG